MSIFEAILFGIVQGITEFLPISSTAHIIITERLLGLEFPGLGFEVLLHLGSVLAVIYFYRKDLWQIIQGFFAYIKHRDYNSKHRIQFYFALYIIIATVITGVLGMILQSLIEDLIKGSTMIAVMLFLTGVFLIVIERFHDEGQRTEANMTFMDSIIVGLGQTLAVIPGLSRSGTTLIVGLWLGLDRHTAVRYSFLLSIPVILGSTVLAFSDVSTDLFASIGTLPLIITFVATFMFSIIGIKWLINFLKRGKLVYFASYCFALAVGVYLFL